MVYFSLKEGDVMEIHERIKTLRKEYLEMTQQDFATTINISRSNLGNIETGRVKVTDRNISDICNKFSVNEISLRTGDGWPKEMFIKINAEDKFSISLGKLSASENDFLRNAVNYLADTNPEKLKIVEEFMKSCLGME